MLRRPRSTPPEADQAQPTALRLLAQREHSQRELFQKLSQRGFSREVIEQTLTTLRDEGWQSDTRFAASYLRARLARGHGALTIAAELRHRGVDAEAIEAAWQEESPDWFALAVAQRRRQFGAAALSVDERRKAYRHLTQRGFRHDEAMAALDAPPEAD